LGKSKNGTERMPDVTDDATTASSAALAAHPPWTDTTDPWQQAKTDLASNGRAAIAGKAAKGKGSASVVTTSTLTTSGQSFVDLGMGMSKTNVTGERMADATDDAFTGSSAVRAAHPPWTDTTDPWQQATTELDSNGRASIAGKTAKGKGSSKAAKSKGKGKAVKNGAEPSAAQRMLDRAMGASRVGACGKVNAGSDVAKNASPPGAKPLALDDAAINQRLVNFLLANPDQLDVRVALLRRLAESGTPIEGLHIKSTHVDAAASLAKQPESDSKYDGWSGWEAGACWSDTGSGSTLGWHESRNDRSGVKCGDDHADGGSRWDAHTGAHTATNSTQSIETQEAAWQAPSAALAESDDELAAYDERLVCKSLDFLRLKHGSEQAKTLLSDSRSGVGSFQAKEAIRRYDLEVLRKFQ
jgi:hypothetical protein